MCQSLQRLKRFVKRQSEDDGLWFIATYISEDYLQHELRKLHAAIENARCDCERS